MKPVFADTFYWIALTNPRDSFHHRVLEFSRSLRPQSIVTTDEVLTELLTFSSADQQLRLEASLVVNDVLADDNVRVIPQTRQSFLAGFALYQARPDKGYSLTDCISMQTMRHSGLTDVLTNDRHFEQEGFRALFRDS
jgi:predicted nucleic acid-binding protein